LKKLGEKNATLLHFWKSWGRHKQYIIRIRRDPGENLIDIAREVLPGSRELATAVAT
jgi:hypothetical protein